MFSCDFQDLSGHPLGKKLTRPFEDLESYLQEVEDTEFRWKKSALILLFQKNIDLAQVTREETK